jgi:ketosteroid isomerase-like protein
MKIIISLLTSAFLATLAIAQEESPSPAESTAPTAEEKASATVEETPTVSITPAPQKAEEPASTATPAKAATGQKKETPTTAAKPATAVSATAAAPSGKNLTGEAAIKDMENRWEAAVASHSYSTVEGFVAADFMGVSSKGKFVNRSQMLGEFKGDKDAYKTAKNEKLNVRMYGPNVAIVTGRAREIGTGKDGKGFDRAFLFTDTWVIRGGKWQCVASQISKIKG